MLKNTATVVNAVKYAVKARGAWQAFVTENEITREMIADTARELAAIAYPSDEPVQTVTTDGVKTRTRFGNAVQAAGNGMRSVLNKADEDDAPKTAVLRVSLSGEGGGSAVVDMDSDLGKAILAHLASEQN